MYKKILAAIDISVSSKQIVKKAIELAKLYDSELILAHVSPIAITDGTFETGMSTVFTVDDENEVKEQLKNLTAFCEKAGVKKVSRVVECSTNIAYTITHAFFETENYDLVICGNSHRHGLERLLLGSTAKAVTKDAKTDVLVVKTIEIKEN